MQTYLHPFIAKPRNSR